MEKIRGILKKIYIPIVALRIQNYRLKSLYKSHAVNNKQRLISEMIQDYHVLEKGLTMPKMRLGFGKKIILKLSQQIITYVNIFDLDNKQLLSAASVIFEYKKVHDQKKYQLEKEVLNAINNVANLKLKYSNSIQLSLTSEVFFENNDSNFYNFSHSRYTVRNFKENVSLPLERVIKAIELAQNSPSACNRQSVRLKVIINKELIAKVFEIQSGNRGFGNLVDKLIIVTTDMSYWNYVTTIGGYIDSGIYMMNLLYSLHYYKIGACTLNTLFNKQQDLKVRDLINLPPTEVITGFIGVGEVSENLKVANSARNNYENILTIID